ncbi:MAG: DUF7948 domain-containing protein, partial [Candidatus Hodarchaeales archaeon]
MNKNKFLLFSALLLLTSITQVIKFDDHDFDNQSGDQFRRVPRLVSTDIQDAVEENNPAISDELRVNVKETLKGFTGGFLANKGQKNDAIHYYTENSQMSVGFGTSEIKFSIGNPSTDNLENADPLEEQLIDEKVTYTTVALEFLGSNKIVPIAQKPTGVFSNYFMGSDEAKWVLSSQYYTQLIYYNIYEKI